MNLDIATMLENDELKQLDETLKEIDDRRKKCGAV